MDILNIKKALKQQGVTYDKLSELSNIPIGTIKSIFSGRTPNPRIDTIDAIKKALNIPDSEEDKKIASPISEDEATLLEMFRNMDEINQKLLLQLADKMTYTSNEMELKRKKMY